MTTTEYIAIGTIQKPHGVEGEMRILVDDPFWDDLLDAPALFFDFQGNKTPFFIEYLNEDHLTILKLEDVDTREQAAELKSKKIFLRKEDVSQPLEEAKEGSLQYSFLKGFLILDADSGETIGRIEEVEEYPQQEMAVVLREGKTVLVPLHEQLIHTIDPDRQEVRLHLPEGLLDL